MTQFVALIQQGMVLDQNVVAVGDDEAALQTQATEAAEKLNNEQTGFGEGWTAVVLPVR
jgi:hypothetical protein